ncbi:hypothetical protein ONS95_014239 [Cadophora gregata]|uniref:uncharacterized protein n=1 Tax=Cadophora gregata TaxID=51156 RepID=UPI0026DD6274|nr:uncharacterized protein ONS95_014239 [Cadophora gregata]KAK0114756.1 hypothetical protein ONS95_014239 [Cadophora gregata]
MVLVRVDVPLRPKSQPLSDDESIAESTSAKAPLPQAADGSRFHVEPRLASDAVNNPQVPVSEDRQKRYWAQLKQLEIQNRKRLLMARQEMAESEQKQANNTRARDSLESNVVSSREDYHMQQMVLEQENGRRLTGTRH